MRPLSLYSARLSLYYAGFSKVVIRTGKTTAEVPVRVENGDSKYSSTTVRLSESGGKQHITEIRLGGTTTRLIVGE